MNCSSSSSKLFWSCICPFFSFLIFMSHYATLTVWTFIWASKNSPISNSFLNHSPIIDRHWSGWLITVGRVLRVCRRTHKKSTRTHGTLYVCVEIFMSSLPFVLNMRKLLKISWKTTKGSDAIWLYPLIDSTRKSHESLHLQMNVHGDAV